jgi:hypothetical protein
VGFSVMQLKLLKIAIVDILEMRAVDITEFALKMIAHPKMKFEGFEIVKSLITELTVGMV